MPRDGVSQALPVSLLPDPGLSLDECATRALVLPERAACSTAVPSCIAQHPPPLPRWLARHGQVWGSGVSPRYPAAPALISVPPLAQEELVNNTELVQSYRQQIGSVVNQFNLQLFLNMYNR